MLEQLLDVKGISEVTLARIRSIIVLEYLFTLRWI